MPAEKYFFLDTWRAWYQYSTRRWLLGSFGKFCPGGSREASMIGVGRPALRQTFRARVWVDEQGRTRRFLICKIIKLERLPWP